MVHPVRLFHAGTNIFAKSPPLGNQAPRVDVGPMARTGPEKGWLCRKKLKSFGFVSPTWKGAGQGKVLAHLIIGFLLGHLEGRVQPEGSSKHPLQPGKLVVNNVSVIRYYKILVQSGFTVQNILRITRTLYYGVTPSPLHNLLSYSQKVHICLLKPNQGSFDEKEASQCPATSSCITNVNERSGTWWRRCASVRMLLFHASPGLLGREDGHQIFLTFARPRDKRKQLEGKYIILAFGFACFLYFLARARQVYVSIFDIIPWKINLWPYPEAH